MILERPRSGKGSRGRAENIYSLAEAGFEWLLGQGDIQSFARLRMSMASVCLPEHDLLLNWFRIHFKRIEEVLPQLSCSFFSSASVFCPVDDHGMPLLRIRAPMDQATEEVRDTCFRPDGVFRIRDTKREKSVLFLPGSGHGDGAACESQRDGSDIAQKVLNYQGYMFSGRYKALSKSGGRTSRLSGAVPDKHAERMISVCRLIREMKTV